MTITEALEKLKKLGGGSELYEMAAGLAVKDLVDHWQVSCRHWDGGGTGFAAAFLSDIDGTMEELRKLRVAAAKIVAEVR
jgi:hypothetical protein